MKATASFSVSLLVLSLMGCSAKIEGGALTPKVAEDQKPISSTQLAGQVYARSWTALSGSFYTNDDGSKIVEISSDPADLCQPISNRRSGQYIDLVLPKTLDKKVYVSDVSRGQSEAHVKFYNATTNEVRPADVSTVQIISQSEKSLIVGIYASQVQGTVLRSEVNGQIELFNCENYVNAAIWDQFKGAYLLVNFDGRTLNYQEQTPASIVRDKRTYRSADGSYLSILALPLFYRVAENYSESVDLGPIDSLGVSWKEKSEAGADRFRFQMNDKIYIGSGGYQTLLDVTVEAMGSKQVKISYSLDIHGQIQDQKHTMILERVSY